jgi:hypothetical protein
LQATAIESNFVAVAADWAMPLHHVWLIATHLAYHEQLMSNKN